MSESLHTHTTLSDGKLSHKELFELAESLGVTVLAYTDHDAVPDDATLDFLNGVRHRATKWVLGIEISAALPRDMGGAHVGNLHILGLFLDPKSEALLDHCQKAQSARIERMEGMVRKLTKLGFTITTEDCLKESGGESVGRPHIVSALAAHPENAEVMERLRMDMEMAAKDDPGTRAAYEQMMAKGESQYPYALFLSSEAFRPAYEEHRYMPDLDQAAALIRGAGGIAILAHYFSVARQIDIPAFEHLIAEKRLDGAEIVYGLRMEGTPDAVRVEADRRAIAEIVGRHGAIAAGGSDAHTSDDLRYFASQSHFSNMTNGLTAAILASGRVQKAFSSFDE